MTRWAPWRIGSPPIVHAARREFIEYDNPFDVGMTGLLGFASGFRAMDDADTLLILGSDFPYAVLPQTVRPPSRSTFRRPTGQAASARSPDWSATCVRRRMPCCRV